MHSLRLAALLGLSLSAAWPLGDDFGDNFFLAPRSGNGKFFSSSSSSSSESILAPGSDGKLHRVVRELHNDEVNDGQQERHARTAVACIDGRCEQRVQRASPVAAESRALAPTEMESQGPHDQQMMTMPGDMMQGFHDRMKDMMSEMTQPLASIEDLGDAVDEDADPGRAENLANTDVVNGHNLQESFSRSYSYSNINGKRKEDVRVQRCRNGNCETVEQHGDGTPASSQAGVGAAQSKVRNTPEEGILVAKEASTVAGRDD